MRTKCILSCSMRIFVVFPSVDPGASEKQTKALPYGTKAPILIFVHGATLHSLIMSSQRAVMEIILSVDVHVEDDYDEDTYGYHVELMYELCFAHMFNAALSLQTKLVRYEDAHVQFQCR